MIEFYSENQFKLNQEEAVRLWIEHVIQHEDHHLGDISYVFCDDEYLLQLNKDFLDHDTYTDIISFDYSLGKQIHGEIYISTQRVAENARTFKNSFKDELHRVIIHGILHCCGYKDGTDSQKKQMRNKETWALNLRSFV